MCLALGEKPTVRAINEQVRRARTNGKPGKGVRPIDICSWLKNYGQRETNGKQTDYHAGNNGKQNLLVKQHDQETNRESDGKPSRARHKVLELKAISLETSVSKAARPKPVKQTALALGAAAPPEIDYDRRKLDMPENLPGEFPDAVDDLRDLAETFCRTFGGCKKAEALQKSLTAYTNTLAVFRQRGVSVAVAWSAFRDAVLAQGGQPLFRGASRGALAFLPSGRRPFVPKGPRVDSCGCNLPDGVFLPRLQKGETAHWDGDEWIYGSDMDPR